MFSRPKSVPAWGNCNVPHQMCTPPRAYVSLPFIKQEIWYAFTLLYFPSRFKKKLSKYLFLVSIWNGSLQRNQPNGKDEDVHGYKILSCICSVYVYLFAVSLKTFYWSFYICTSWNPPYPFLKFAYRLTLDKKECKLH